MHACMHAVYRNRSEVRKLYCTVEFVSESVIEASKLVTIEVESRSHTPSLRLRHRCAHYIDDLLPHVSLQLCSYWGYDQVFHAMNKSSYNKLFGNEL